MFFSFMMFPGPSGTHKCVFWSCKDFLHDLKVFISSIYTVCIRVFPYGFRAIFIDRFPEISEIFFGELEKLFFGGVEKFFGI